MNTTVWLLLCTIYILTDVVIADEEPCFDQQSLIKDIRKYSDKIISLIKAKCEEETANSDNGNVNTCIYNKVFKSLEHCENENLKNRKEFADCVYNKMDVKGLKRMPFADYKRMIMKYVKNPMKKKLISEAVEECKNLPKGLFICTIRKLAKGPCPELKKEFYYASTSEEADD